MPSPSYFAACGLLLTAPALAGNYPPPPGPYVNPAVQQWLAARTEPLLASARRDAAEAPLTGSATGEPGVSTRLISARADRQPAPGSWSEPAENAPGQPDFRPIDRWAKPAATGSTGPEWYAGEPLRWRDPVADPVAQSGADRLQYRAAPRQGLLDPLPAEPVYQRGAGNVHQRREFSTTEPATGHHRSTEQLLALYLDYEPAGAPGQPGPAAAHVETPAAKPESRRYYYRPTGTTFEFRALEREPREPIQAGSGDAADWNFRNPSAAKRR